MALGLVQMCQGMLAWHAGNLRLRDGAIASRKDFSRTYLSGRFGEASTYLFMLRQAYVFWDHLPSLVDRALKRSYPTHLEQLRVARAIRSKVMNRHQAEQPDFAFEKATKEVALAESKGSFVSQTKKGTIKEDLGKALGQLAGWEQCIRPKPQRSFAVGTYMREESDRSVEPSLLAFADPAGDPTDVPGVALFPDDWIRRGNYGAWLCGMGFDGGGAALRTRTAYVGVEQRLPVIRVDNSRFAFTIAAFGQLGSPAIKPATKSGKQERAVGNLSSGMSAELSRMLAAAGRVPLIIGVEVSRLRLIESAIGSPENESLMTIEEFRGDPNTSSTPVLDHDIPEWYEGSMLPDGTLFGLLNVDHPLCPGVEFENFTL